MSRVLSRTLAAIRDHVLYDVPLPHTPRRASPCPSDGGPTTAPATIVRGSARNRRRRWTKARPRPHPRTSRGDRDESVSERADRNYIEIVQELRIAQTGVQILFGFLLALAFYETFPVNSSPNREVLTAALICTVGAAVCFTAPVVVHRLHFRQGEKEPLVWVAHRLTLAGMVLFTLGMGLALWLVLARLWSVQPSRVSTTFVFSRTMYASSSNSSTSSSDAIRVLRRSANFSISASISPLMTPQSFFFDARIASISFACFLLLLQLVEDLLDLHLRDLVELRVENRGHLLVVELERRLQLLGRVRLAARSRG